MNDIDEWVRIHYLRNIWNRRYEFTDKRYIKWRVK